MRRMGGAARGGCAAACRMSKTVDGSGRGGVRVLAITSGAGMANLQPIAARLGIALRLRESLPDAFRGSHGGAA
eukprot:scaffold3941_cov412-Prasinococcus_capsulatus_cf.AAC.12